MEIFGVGGNGVNGQNMYFSGRGLGTIIDIFLSCQLKLRTVLLKSCADTDF